MTSDSQKRYALVALLLITNILSVSTVVFILDVTQEETYVPLFPFPDPIYVINETRYVPVNTSVSIVTATSYVDNDTWDIAWGGHPLLIPTPSYYNNSFVILISLSTPYNSSTSYNISFSFRNTVWENQSQFGFVGFKILIYNFTTDTYYHKHSYELPSETIMTKNFAEIIFFAYGSIAGYNYFSLSPQLVVTTTIGYDD